MAEPGEGEEEESEDGHADSSRAKVLIRGGTPAPRLKRPEH
jgi:hypothetical protein